MHHAKKIYTSTPKKQRRQIEGQKAIQSRRMKTLHDRKEYDADRARLFPAHQKTLK